MSSSAAPDKPTGVPLLLMASAVLVLVMTGVALTSPDWFARGAEAVNRWIYHYFGGFYLWFALLTTVAFVLLGVSPLGRLRLGGADARPEFGFWSWFAMIFSAGMGSGILFWGAAEPLYHFLHAPPGQHWSVLERQDVAFAYTFFHWGLSPWAIYGMTAVAMGYFSFNRGLDFRFSTFLTSDRQPAARLWHLGIDLMAVMAIIFGVAATIGMATLSMEGGLRELLDVPGSPLLEIGLMGLIAVIFVSSALKGIDAGIKFLSNLSMWLCLGLLVLFMVSGPLWPALQSLGRGLGLYARDFLPMSLGMGAFHDPLWVADWTVKYWSWWIAWAPFVGIFLVLISRGRTIREIVLACVLAPTGFSCLWFAVFGQSAMALQQAGAFPADLLDFHNVNRIYYYLLSQTPGWPVTAWLSLGMMALFVGNSADSATYTVACLSDQHTGKPRIGVVLGWGGLFLLLSLTLLLAGGIVLLNQITTITVLPFTALLVVAYGVFLVSLWKNRPRLEKQPGAPLVLSASTAEENVRIHLGD